MFYVIKIILNYFVCSGVSLNGTHLTLFALVCSNLCSNDAVLLYAFLSYMIIVSGSSFFEEDIKKISK